MLPFFWSWVCLLLGIAIELKYRRGSLRPLMLVILIVATSAYIWAFTGNREYSLGPLVNLIGIGTVLLHDYFRVKYFKKTKD